MRGILIWLAIGIPAILSPLAILSVLMGCHAF